MFPKNINPKQMSAMMKKMGIKTEQVDAEEVIIKCIDKEIIIDQPEVVKTDMKGMISFQISGNVSQREIKAEVEFGDDDIEMVMEQTGAGREDCIEALKKTGDIAEAIMMLGNKE